jgi:sugar/nucleoside kinase (ribokinase family)
MSEDQQNPEMLCIGNAIVDIFVQTDDAFLERFGVKDRIQHVEYPKIVEILKQFPDYSVGSGGGAANVAKIAALLGIRSGFIGTIGSGDPFAEVFERNLSGAGVQTFLSKSEAPTGACVFLQRYGEPDRIVAAPSAAYRLGPSDITADAVREAQVVVIDGYIMERGDLVQRVLDLAGEYGTVVALDVGSVELAKTYAAEIIAYCRKSPLVLFMNQDEATAFYNGLDHGIDDDGEDLNFVEKLLPRNPPLPQKVQTFLQKLTNDIFPIIAVKLGAKGAIVFVRGTAHRENTLTIIPQETTGAGDAFCAAFLSAWLRDKPIVECAGFGNKAAREVLDVNGTLVDQKKFVQIARMITG